MAFANCGVYMISCAIDTVVFYDKDTRGIYDFYYLQLFFYKMSILLYIALESKLVISLKFGVRICSTHCIEPVISLKSEVRTCSANCLRLYSCYQLFE